MIILNFCPAMTFVAYLLLLGEASSSSSNVTFFTSSEHLDTEEKFLLQWTINPEEDTIYFEVLAKTMGYVGFGFSPNGGMNGADILVAGVHSNGSIYNSDRHGVGDTEPVEDAQQNWNVTFAEETETHTKLRFHRLLNTCDQNDFRITDATMRIIWAIGETDKIVYHGPGTSKGTKSINLFMTGESSSAFDATKYKQVDITVTREMSSDHTSYWCSIHRLPLFTEKQHIVGFEPIFETVPAIQHTHHFIMYQCLAPADENPDDIFESWAEAGVGDSCNSPKQVSFPFRKYCRDNAIYVWSKGGKRMEFPDELGLPLMAEKMGQKIYYGIEIHYTNPGLLQGISFKTGGRIFYTPELRDVEVGLMVVSYNTDDFLTIPPQSEDFVVAGHCSPECTTKTLPTEGVTIFNNLMHAHLAGRKMKLRHFRGNEELPWIDNEEYYDYNFQQNKPLLPERELKPGDQLTVECTYSTMNTPGKKAVVGGYTEHEEMCQAWFFYFPSRSTFERCDSFYREKTHFDLLGITKYDLKSSDWSGGQQLYNILEPNYLAGDYLEALSYKVNWTQKFRERFQKEKRFGEHIGSCAKSTVFLNETMLVKYPKTLKEYAPINECDISDDENGSNGVSTSPLFCIMPVMVFIYTKTVRY